jgi:ABC-type glycerol-3-phosphate transport system permease component
MLFMLAIAAVFLLPYEWMFSSAFKSTAEIFKYSWPVSWKTFLPPAPTLENFRVIFRDWNFGRNMLNSLFVSVCQVVGTLVVCSLSAFALTRMRFPGQGLIFGAVMLIALVPFEVVMVPLYVTVREMGLQNSYAALFLPWLANPFGVFLLRQAFTEIPRDYDEAAIIEGASPSQIFRHIILPNSRPALITLALMSFLWSWNAFMWPLIIMQDVNKQVVQVAIATFTLPYQLPAWGEIFAGATAATVPVLIVFSALQRYYVRGVVMSGLKG